MNLVISKVVGLSVVLMVGLPLFGQCGPAEMEKMSHLTASFQADVTIFDSLSRKQLGSFRQMANDCTKAITAKAQRAGIKSMNQMPKDDLIALFWIATMDDTAGSVIVLRDAEELRKPSTAPSATEMFHLRSECSELGKRILDEIVSSLPKPPATAQVKESQVSHYNSTANRCYVETTLEMKTVDSPYRTTVVVLSDGQTRENLASVQEEGTECPSGKECKWSGSIHDTTQHHGFDDSLDGARTFIGEAMEYPQP